MSTVYQIRNLESGRVYVGATIHPLRTRWGGHTSALKHRRHASQDLQDDWERLGSDGFAVEELESVEDVHLLGAREIAWIEARRAEGVNLYNHSRKSTYRLLRRAKPWVNLAFQEDPEVVGQIDAVAKVERLLRRAQAIRLLLRLGLKAHEKRGQMLADFDTAHSVA